VTPWAAPVSDLCLQDAVGLAGLLRRREVSAREVVSAHIARVEAFDPAVEPEVLEVLAPAREVLAGLAGTVTDATPDLSGADEVFRTFRALRFATFSGALPRERPGCSVSVCRGGDSRWIFIYWRIEAGSGTRCACHGAVSSRASWKPIYAGGHP
jgi:hypothetical protein